MAILAVNKDGTELISDRPIYRNGNRRRYMRCDPLKCKRCIYNSRLFCKTDENGKRYKSEHYSEPPQMTKSKAIESLHFWDNFEHDPDCNRLDYTIELPKGTIKKLIGRDMSWEDEPIELK